MKLLFSGSTICSEETLKWLLVIADEIAFMDRPSVSFGEWGTIGAASEVRNYIGGMAGQPVTMSIHSPPSGPANELYQRYVLADFANEKFRHIFFQGLSNSEAFAGKLLDSEAKYGEYSGTQVLTALLNDHELLRVPIEDMKLEWEPFKIADSLGRKDTLRILLATASLQLTNAMIISGQTGHMPVTDDPYFGQLLAMRSSEYSYVGGTSPVAPMLGIEVAKAILPDQALQKLSLDEILGYRENAKEAYAAWAIELRKLATSLDGLDASEIQRQIPKVIAKDIHPRLLEHQNEMKSIADRLFGDLIKGVTRWEVPTLSLAYISNLSFSQAVGAFVAALTPAIPSIVDYVQSRREVSRKHAISYLIGLAERSKLGQ